MTRASGIKLFAVQSAAQTLTGDITGRVLDANGAVVPNAKVTVRSAGTGLARTATTNDEGEYTVTQLPPGNYEIVVEASGFSKVLIKDVQLLVGTRQTLNVDLKAGAVTETVEVTSEDRRAPWAGKGMEAGECHFIPLPPFPCHCALLLFRARMV
ncbi:MAG: carboxypeptidase-like regulatory domain-containing protein [Blastocatellia bacterium]